MTGKRRAGRKPEPPRRPATLTPPPSPSVVIAPIPTRRQARIERRKQQRKRVGLLGGAAIGVAAAVVIAAAAFGVHHAVTHHGGAKRTQVTLLFQLEGTGNTAAASVLLAHDSGGNEGLEVLVPPRVITDVCGYNTVNFGDVLALPSGDAASRQALSTMLGNATIDGSWILSSAQLADLVQAVGGITADVDVPVVRHTGGGGGQVLIAAGDGKHLNGQQAVEYATYSTSANAAAADQLTRVQQVVDGLIQALPKTQVGIEADLRRLGPGGSSTLGTARLASLLASLASSYQLTGHFSATDLPVTPIDSGGAPSYRIDSVGAKSLVSTSLSGSVPPGANTPRPSVELLNGVGTPGLVATACPRLAAHKFTYAGSGNAGSFNNPTSSVVTTNSQINVGYAVASALGLPRGDVERTPDDQTVATVIVTLGRDYNP